MNRWKAYLLISSLFIILSFVAGGMSASGAAVAATHNATQGEINIDFTAIPEGMRIMPPPPEVMEQRKLEGQPLPDLSNRAARGIDAGEQFPNPPSGMFNILVIAVDFNDIPSSVGLPAFDTLIFAPPGGPPSVADYFHEISYGNLTLVTFNPPSSLGWQRAPNNSSYYINSDGITGTGDDYGWGTYPKNLQGLTAHAIAAIDPLVDFSQYDNDGDGFVDSVVFIHAGRGAELSLSPSDIWSVAWDMTSFGGPGPILTGDGVRIDNFTYDPEYMVTPGDQTMGVYCHEIGHTFFGLPDLYDLDGSSYGVGNWSLMSYGSWNGLPIYIPWFSYSISGGSSPAWPDAWSRVQMGFETPLQFQGNIPSFLFQPVETLPSAGIGVVKLDSPNLGPEEYFLAENRQRLGYDAFLPGDGLLIWHIDEEKWNLWEGNDYECTTSPCCGGQCPTWHPLVALEQADGNLDLEWYTNPGDAGDPFPGSSNNRSFAWNTTPESGSWFANPCPSNSCISLTNLLTTWWPDIIADLGVVCTAGISGCLDIQVDEPLDWGNGGNQVNFLASIRNCSTAFDPSVTLGTVNQWPLSFYDPSTGLPLPTPPTSSIAPGAAWNVGISVTVPASAIWGQMDNMILTATSSFPGVSAIQALTARVPQCVLVVDDDMSAPDVEAAYTSALSANNIYPDTWNVLAGGRPSANLLAAHSSVVWLTGSPRVATLSPLDELALASYLDGGGSLLLSSADYLYDAGRTAFNREYLGMGTWVDDTTTFVVFGAPGDPVGNGLGPYPFLYPSAFSDVLTPIPLSNSSGAFFDYTQANFNALTNFSANWRTLFLAWPFENLNPGNAAELMGRSMSWFNVPGAPLVSFTVDDQAVIVGQEVHFTNTSTGADSFYWDFGDGATSNLTNPTHTYTAPMQANVTLQADNQCARKLYSLQVDVYWTPVAGFTPSATQVTVGETVTFTNTSQNATAYSWDFGDGGSSTQANPSHSYSSEGLYAVELTASNPAEADSYVVYIFVGDNNFYYLPLTMRH